MTISVDEEYLEELEKKAKKHDFFEGYIKGIEVAFAFAEELVKSISNSKDEPQTEYDKYREKIRAHDPHKDWFEDEPQTDCSTCETYWNCQGQCDEMPQIEDEPQTERSNARKFLGYACETCEHRDEEWDSEACDSCCENNDHYESQTDCAWG